MADNKLNQHASVKRKVYQWLLKTFQDDALSGDVQVLDSAPDVADLVELMRGAGYRLSAIDIGINTSTTSTNASASASAATPGCQITIKCQRSGLGVTMEAAGKADCHCPDTPAEDHSVSAWSVVSSQENLSRPAVGSSLLPPVPADVSEVVGSTVRCAVRILREWPSARAPPPLPAQAPSTTLGYKGSKGSQGSQGSLTPGMSLSPSTPLSPQSLPSLVPRRPAPPPPNPFRRASTDLLDVADPGVSRRRPYRSLDAVQWSATAGRDTPTPPPWFQWGRSASSLGPTPTPPHSRSPLPTPDVPERPFPHRPRARHSQSPPRRHSEGAPPVPPRRSYHFTLDDYLAYKRTKGNEQEQGYAPERSRSVNDIYSSSRRFSDPLKKWGVSEPPSLTTLQEAREVQRPLAERPLIAMSPKGTKVIITDATDFVTKAELTMRQIGSLIQSVKNWMITGGDDPEMTEPLVKITAKDSTESDSSEESAIKPTPKASSKKGVRRLIPTLSGKPKAAVGSTPRPTGPSSRFSDPHPKLARTFMTKAVEQAVPTRTFVRPKKDNDKDKDRSKTAGTDAVARQPSRSGSDNGSEKGSGRRQTIAGTTLPHQRPSGGAAQQRVSAPGSRIPATPAASSATARPAPHVATSTAVSQPPRSMATSGTRSVVSVAASSAANVAASVAARMAFKSSRAREAETRSKGAIPRMPRDTADTGL